MVSLAKKHDEQTETEKSPFEVGDEVEFKLEKNDFTGYIDKAYNNAFLITFESNDPEIIDKYHNKTVVNHKDLKMIKQAPRIQKDPDEESDDDSKKDDDQKSSDTTK
ncbi:hypothetical protein IV37_GL001438 [Fructilactobacillus fructivorans]|nr:hypothetical protein IV37_GL001438 [Fructilactobacillus fructivorans]